MLRQIRVPWMILVLLALCGILKSQDAGHFGKVDNVATQKGESVSRFLTPDGRLDLDAMRAGGFQGQLDLSGFSVRL